MKTIGCFVPFILALVGCSGGVFTAGFSVGAPADAAEEADSGTGGKAPLVEVDSGVVVGSGGSSGHGGARSSSGGQQSDNDDGGTGDAAVPPDAACALVTHTNGLEPGSASSTWWDCVPSGTYNFSQATRACLTSGAVQCVNMPDRCGFGAGAVRGFDKPGNDIGSWGYEGLIAGVFDPTDYWNLCGGLDASLGGAGNRPWR